MTGRFTPGLRSRLNVGKCRLRELVDQGWRCIGEIFDDVRVSSSISWMSVALMDRRLERKQCIGVSVLGSQSGEAAPQRIEIAGSVGSGGQSADSRKLTSENGREWELGVVF